jgi:recombinational DNA repair ATPase RecF
MAKSIDIKDFRGFQHAHLDDWRRINVLAGDNASGKCKPLDVTRYDGEAAPKLKHQ